MPKTKSKTKSKKKSDHKKYIKNIKYQLTPEQKQEVNNNKIISPSNIGQIAKQEVLFNSGIFVVNEKNVLYSLRTPTIIGRSGLYDLTFGIFSTVLSNILIILNKKYKDIIYKIGKAKFSRYLNYLDFNTDVIVDITLLMKILKYIINENLIKEFESLSNKQKIINIFEELIELRNLLAHSIFKQEEYKTQPTLNKYYKKTKKKLNTKQKKNEELYNKIRKNLEYKRYLNYLHYTIDNIIYIILEFKDLNLNIDKRLFNNKLVGLKTIKKVSTNICIEKHRHKQLAKRITTDKQLFSLAQETIDFLQQNLNNKKTKRATSRNIVNMVTTLLNNDSIITKYITREKTKKNLKNKCLKYKLY